MHKGRRQTRTDTHISWSLFLVSLFQTSTKIVGMYVSTFGFRLDKHKSEKGPKLADNAAFASLSAISFQKCLREKGHRL